MPSPQLQPQPGHEKGQGHPEQSASIPLPTLELEVTFCVWGVISLLLANIYLNKVDPSAVMMAEIKLAWLLPSNAFRPVVWQDRHYSVYPNDLLMKAERVSTA